MQYVRMLAPCDFRHRPPIADGHYDPKCIGGELRFGRPWWADVVGAVISHPLVLLDLGGRLLRTEQRRGDDYWFKAQAPLIVDNGAGTDRIAHRVGKRGFQYVKHFHPRTTP